MLGVTVTVAVTVFTAATDPAVTISTDPANPAAPVSTGARTVLSVAAGGSVAVGTVIVTTLVAASWTDVAVRYQRCDHK